MKIRNITRLTSALCVATLTLFHALPSRGGTLVNFPFNEGTGETTTDTVGGAVGFFGMQNPATDMVILADDSPSGTPGDRCITTFGRGFLVVDDSNGPILDIPNGPITLETWVKIDGSMPAKSGEGLVGYGGSYKMGMKGGWQVFTLLGIRDITNSSAGVPVDQWAHLAAAWEPGVGVHFYINGNHTFVEYTNAATAKPASFNYLGIASEGLVVNSLGSFDRVRVHHALLGQGEIDSDAANPKAPLPATLVSYDFNEASFPCQNGKTPARPTMLSIDYFASMAKPVWSSDTPTGLPNDYAIAFNNTNKVDKDRIIVDAPTLDLRGPEGTTNFTVEAWVKLPPALINEREVLLQTYGPAPRVTVSVDMKRNLYATMLGNANYASTVIIPNDNRWHHIAVAMTNRTSVLFYLDGVLRQTMPVTATAASGDSLKGFIIGQESNTRYFRGIMDRLRISDATLTAEQLDFPAIPGQAIVTTQPANLVVDAGGNAQFTPVVSSPSSASYQWFYKTALLAASDSPVPNATGITLDLNNVTTNDQGFYFLRITNAAGVSESYAAQLAVRSGPQWDSMGFEAPTYVTGVFENQDLWTVDQNGGTFLVATAPEIETALTSVGITPGETVHAGSQAVLIRGANAASAAVRPMYGFENQDKVTLEFWARPLTAGTNLPGTTILATNNMFITMENAAGKRAAAIRFGPSESIDYNSAGWKPTSVTWNDQTWYKCVMEVDYAAKTYDVFINDVKVTATPVAFYEATSDKFQAIRIYRGTSQAGIILDDMTAAIPSASLRISNIEVVGGMVNISWEGGLAPYQLQRRISLTTGTWEDVGSPTSNTTGTDQVGPDPMFYQVIGK